MSSYRQMADRVIRTLAGGDPSDDFPIEPEDVYIACSQIIPFLTKKDFYESYLLGERNIDGLFSVTFLDVPVFKTEGNKYPYSILPAKPNIIHGRGRPQVYYTGDRSIAFIYVEAGQVPILHQSGQLDYNDKEIFWIETEQNNGKSNTKAIFDTTLDCCVEKINIRMLPVAEVGAIVPDSPLPIGAHLEHELFEMLMKGFGIQSEQPEDVRPDDTKNK